MIPDFSDFQPNIDADMMVVFNICLAFLMFGIALDMKVGDFKRVAEFPKSVLVGLASQWLILPILTVYLIHIWKPIPSIALGLLLVATCPGGNISNYATHLSRGNAALSVTLSACVAVSSIVATPLMFALFSMFVPQVAPILREIDLNPWTILMLLVQLVLVPMILGMLFNYFFPSLTAKIKKPISKLSLLIFLAFIIAAMFEDIDAIIRYAKYVFFLVVVHNLIALVAGYYWAKWNKLPEPDARAVSMETGIQNSGLGLLLIFTFFPNLPGMMLVTAVWAVWDMVSSFILAVYWSKKPFTPKSPDTSTC
jgi:BASS family bile acid:Na+ symporter